MKLDDRVLQGRRPWREWENGMGRLAACCMVLALGHAAPAPAADPVPIDSRESLNAVLWMQTAHEYAFSTAQVYAMATQALARAGSLASALADPDLPNSDPEAPAAIVLDLDETVLDTTRYGAGLIAAGRRHTEAAWAEWVGAAQAEPLAGALEFLRAAHDRGYRIFYVTNRACPDTGRPAVYPHPACPQRDATLAQARRLGLPAAEDPRAFLFRNDQDGWDGGDKSPRRRFLSTSYKVVMLVGDDLGDFLPRAQVKDLRDQLPRDRTVGVVATPAATPAATPVPAWRGRFGNQWFLLPNPSYGSWEVSLANCDLPDKESLACHEARLQAKYGRLIPSALTSPAAPTAPR